MTRGRVAIAMLILTAVTTAPSPASACVGDCSSNRLVTVDEIVTGVNIALGSGFLEQCRPFDTGGDIAVMNADGSNFHYLTQDSQLNGFPA